MTLEIKTQELEVFFEATHEKYGLLSRKQVCPKASDAQGAKPSWESFGKIETPCKGQVDLDT